MTTLPCEIWELCFTYVVSHMSDFTITRLACKTFNRMLIGRQRFFAAVADMAPFAVQADPRVPSFIVALHLQNVVLVRQMTEPIFANRVIIGSNTVFPIVYPITCKIISCDPVVSSADILNNRASENLEITSCDADLISTERFYGVNSMLPYSVLKTAHTRFETRLRVVDIHMDADCEVFDARLFPNLEQLTIRDEHTLTTFITDETTRLQHTCLSFCESLERMTGLEYVGDVSLKACISMPTSAFRCFGSAAARTVQLDVSTTAFEITGCIPKTLHTLIADNCIAIMDVTDAATCLKVSLRCCEMLDISPLQCVRDLDVSGCRHIRKWPPLCLNECCDSTNDATTKYRLVADRCNVMECDSIAWFASEFYEVHITPYFAGMGWLWAPLKFVGRLNLRGFAFAEESSLNVFHTFQCLVHLELGPCHRLRELDGLQLIRSVVLESCPRITSLAELKSCHTIELIDCVRVRNFEVLKAGTCHTFAASRCPQIHTLRAFVTVVSVSLTNSTGISRLTMPNSCKIRALSLSNQRTLCKISGNCASLTSLDCSGCTALTTLPAAIPCVRYLNITDTQVATADIRAGVLYELVAKRCRRPDHLIDFVPLIHL